MIYYIVQQTEEQAFFTQVSRKGQICEMTDPHPPPSLVLMRWGQPHHQSHLGYSWKPEYFRITNIVAYWYFPTKHAK